MGIKIVEVEINGLPHTVQVNDDDKNAATLAAQIVAKAKPATNKARTPRNKAAKPAANKTAPAPVAVEDASDPGASE